MSVMKVDKKPVSKTEKKRPYEPPVLQKAGNVRELTMGGSPGFGDSGSVGTRNIPGS